MVPYRESANNEDPNPIYNRVFETNRKLAFESDIYSQEFLSFLLQVLTSVSELDETSDTIKMLGI